METKPILIIAVSVILLIGIFLFVTSRYSAKPEKAEIQQFLINFNNKINEGNTDSLLTYFDAHKNIKTLKRLINFLAGKKDINGKGKPQAKIYLDINTSAIKINEAGLATAYIPVTFSHDSLAGRNSVLDIKIYKVAPHKFKIIQIDAKEFLTDYSAYINLVRSKTIPDTAMFSPVTLAAFKTAEQLKTRYDSVVWFQDIEGKTYYYVVKGKWDEDKDINYYKDFVIEPYKMGLVGPDLKEIIPVGYTLIHNIGGTFPNLIEVENGNNKGFFNLNGKEIVPAKYNRIYPIDDENNLAVLQDGPDYYYLKKDFSISTKVDIKLSDFFSRIRKINSASDLKSEALNVITEYNSKSENHTVYLPPSYLVDLNLAKKGLEFPSPYRDKIKQEDDFGQKEYSITPADKIESPENWFLAYFYAIKDYYIDARYEFYDSKDILIIDKKKNRIYTQSMADNYVITDSEDSGSPYESPCNINSIRAINDTLFEVKAGANLWFELYDGTKIISGGPYYHYYSIKNDKLVELPNKRNFGFTKYIKLNDSYLSGCYTMLVGHSENNEGQTKTIDAINADMLKFMKNEIYADYKYQFKDSRWKDIFYKFEHVYNGGDEKPLNANVNDSLTEIDKYNINWIVQKLKGAKAQSNTLATK